MVTVASRSEKLSFILLIALIIWIPIPLGGNRPWAWSLFQSSIVLQTLLLCWAYRYSLPVDRLKPLIPVIVPLLLFQFVTALQLVPLPLEVLRTISPAAAEAYSYVGDGRYPTSLDPAQTEISLWLGISYVLLILNVACTVSSRSRVTAVLYAIVLSGTLQAFYAAMLVLSDLKESPVFGFPVNNGANGSFVYRNHLANYLLLAISMGLGCIISQLSVDRTKDWNLRLKRLVLTLLSPKLLVRLCLIIMVIALVMTRSRMGNSALVIVTVSGAVLAFIAYKQRPKVLTLLMTSLLVIDALIMGAIFGLEKVKERITNTVIEQEARPDIFAWSMEAIKDFPLVGTGAGSFYSIFPAYHQQNIPVFVDHAHNEYIQFVIEYGLIASLLLVLPVLYVLVISIKTLATRQSALMKGTSLGCFMAILAMLIHISVDFNLRPAANVSLFLIAMSLACIVSKMPRGGYSVSKEKSSFRPNRASVSNEQ